MSMTFFEYGHKCHALKTKSKIHMCKRCVIVLHTITHQNEVFPLSISNVRVQPLFEI